MKHLKFIIAIIIMMFIIVLIVQNHGAFSTKVVFRFNLLAIDFESAEISLYSIVPIVFLFGILIAGLYGMIERFQLKKQIREMNVSSREKDEELNSLRTLPITSENVSSNHLNENGME